VDAGGSRPRKALVGRLGSVRGGLRAARCPHRGRAAAVQSDALLFFLPLLFYTVRCETAGAFGIYLWSLDSTNASDGLAGLATTHAIIDSLARGNWPLHHTIYCCQPTWMSSYMIQFMSYL